MKHLFHCQSYSHGTVTLKEDYNRIQISGVLEWCIIINFQLAYCFCYIFEVMTSVIILDMQVEELQVDVVIPYVLNLLTHVFVELHI